MSKKKITIIVIVSVIVVLIGICLFLEFREKSIKDIYAFKKVCSNELETSNLEIHIIDPVIREVGTITDEKEIAEVIKIIANLRVNKAYSLINSSPNGIKIINKDNNKEILLHISTAQVMINSGKYKIYTPTTDIMQKLRPIINRNIEKNNM